jgi:hypothetical protein
LTGNEADDWDVLDNYIAEDFVAHHPPAPGVTLDRAGMKQAAEIFRVGAPGNHAGCFPDGARHGSTVENVVALTAQQSGCSAARR